MRRDDAPWDGLSAGQYSRPWCRHDNHPEPPAADVPAIYAHVDPGELIAAQAPEVVGMHDSSNRADLRLQPREDVALRSVSRSE